MSRWVIRLMTPPLPAESRPSKITTTLSFCVLHPALQLDQFALQAEQLLEIEPAVDGFLGRMSFKLVGQRIEAIVVDLELWFLVIQIQHLGMNTIVKRVRAVEGFSVMDVSAQGRPRLAPLCAGADVGDVTPAFGKADAARRRSGTLSCRRTDDCL